MKCHHSLYLPNPAIDQKSAPTGFPIAAIVNDEKLNLGKHLGIFYYMYLMLLELLL